MGGEFTEFCPAGTVSGGPPDKESVSSSAPETRCAPRILLPKQANRTNEISQMESDKACLYPISSVDVAEGPPRKDDDEVPHPGGDQRTREKGKWSKADLPEVEGLRRE